MCGVSYGKIVIYSSFCTKKSVQEKESIISERYGSTNLSLGSLFGITRQSLVMPNSDPWDRFVDPYLTLMTDSYNLHGYHQLQEACYNMLSS